MRDTIVKIYPQMMAMAKAYIHYYNRPDVEAEDVVQQAVVNVLERDTGEAEDQERYLYGSVINALRDILRDSRRREYNESEWCYLTPTQTRLDHTKDTGDALNLDMDAAIEALTYMDRHALDLIMANTLHGIPYAELAEIFATTEQALHDRVYRERLKINAIYREAGKEKMAA